MRSVKTTWMLATLVGTCSFAVHALAGDKQSDVSRHAIRLSPEAAQALSAQGIGGASSTDYGSFV